MNLYGQNVRDSHTDCRVLVYLLHNITGYTDHCTSMEFHTELQWKLKMGYVKEHNL